MKMVQDLIGADSPVTSLIIDEDCKIDPDCIKWIIDNNFRTLRIVKVGHHLPDLAFNTLNTCSTLEVFSCLSVGQSILQELEQLEELAVIHFPDPHALRADLVIFLNNCSGRLTSVGVTSSSIVDDSVLEVIARRHNTLTHLDLTDDPAVTDAGVIQLAATCNKLTRLVVNRCQNITDAGLSAISAHSGLVHLDISVTRISDEGIATLSQYSRHSLEYLDCSGCPEISGETITFYYLRTLVMRYCGNLTDVGLQNIANSAVRLEQLDISHCENITDTGVGAIVRQCHTLREIVLKQHYCKVVLPGHF